MPLIPMVIERTRARRARVRHLLAPAQRADHLPRHRRSTTRSPTSSSPSCCTWSPRTPTRTSRSTSTRPGGSIYSGLAIYDTMQLRQARRRRRCASASRCPWARCCSPAARRASARRCPTAGSSSTSPRPGFEGQSTDIEIHAREILKIRERVDEIYAQHTGKPVEEVHADMERDRFFTARAGRRVRPDRPRADSH